MERYAEVLRETVSRVRVGEKDGEIFWTEREVRQVSIERPVILLG